MSLEYIAEQVARGVISGKPQTIDGATLGSNIGNSAVGIYKASKAYDKLDVAIKKAVVSAEKQAEADGITASSIVDAQTRAGAVFEKGQGTYYLGGRESDIYP